MDKAFIVLVISVAGWIAFAAIVEILLHPNRPPSLFWAWRWYFWRRLIGRELYQDGDMIRERDGGFRCARPSEIGYMAVLAESYRRRGPVVVVTRFDIESALLCGIIILALVWAVKTFYH